MKALVVGASGLVGSHLMHSGRARGWQMTGTYAAHPEDGLIHLDMGNIAQVESVLRSERPDALFLTAFNPNVDACELHPEETHITNVQGNEHVIAAASALGIRMAYFSSDYVFDGENGPYREEDVPHPINAYGRQKLEVERAIQTLKGDHLIVRTTNVYGWERQEKNFFCRVLRELRAKKGMRVPNDQYSNPTLAHDIAEASCKLVEAKIGGIVHVTGSDHISRFMFAQEIARAFNLPVELVLPVETKELMQTAPRPLRGGLKCERMRKLLGWQPRGVQEGLSFLRSTSL